MITPMKTFVLVAEMKDEMLQTESGIILEGAKSVKSVKRAKVLAVGKDVTDVQAGDVVMLDWAKAKPVMIEDEQRAMIKQEDIIAVYE